jgi:hypothetical protein
VRLAVELDVAVEEKVGVPVTLFVEVGVLTGVLVRLAVGLAVAVEEAVGVIVSVLVLLKVAVEVEDVVGVPVTL